MVKRLNDAAVAAGKVLRLEHGVSSRQELIGQRELLRQDVEGHRRARHE
jgi:hypothetical protein